MAYLRHAASLLGRSEFSECVEGGWGATWGLVEAGDGEGEDGDAGCGGGGVDGFAACQEGGAGGEDVVNDEDVFVVEVLGVLNGVDAA